MREGKWPKKEYSKGMELTGKTLGIFGLGAIGRETAKRAVGLMMNVIAYDPFVTKTDLNVKLVSKDELLEKSDFISMHMPFIKSEGPTITEKEFEKMKKGVVLVNCARGGVVKDSGIVDPDIDSPPAKDDFLHHGLNLLLITYIQQEPLRFHTELGAAFDC